MNFVKSKKKVIILLLIVAVIAGAVAVYQYTRPKAVTNYGSSANIRSMHKVT